MWPRVQDIFLVLVFSVSTVQSGSEEVDGILDRCLLLIDEYSKEKPSPEPTIEVSVHGGLHPSKHDNYVSGPTWVSVVDGGPTVNQR